MLVGVTHRPSMPISSHCFKLETTSSEHKIDRERLKEVSGEFDYLDGDLQSPI